MSLTKYASLENVQILAVKGAPVRQRHASLRHLADFEDYRTSDGFLYARIRAISSRVNKNHDGWPSIELAGDQSIFDRHVTSAAGFTVKADSQQRYGFSTFLGKPIYIDHNNSDPKRTRGAIVDSNLRVFDHKTAATSDEYWGSSDVDPEHMPPTEIELLLEVDAKSFPKFAKAIVEGSRNPKKGIDGWSMGCFVPGTPITLADGTQKPIETIELGDTVLTHTGKREPVTYLLKRPFKGLIYDLTTYGQARSLRMTEEHPVWIKRTGATVRGKRQVQGGVCACGRAFASRASFGAHLREVARHDLPGEHSRDATETIGWVPANEVREGDYVLTPAPEGVGHPGSYPFARLLGYYLAEGNLGYDRKRFADGRPVFAEWTFAVDEIEYQAEVQLLAESLGYQVVGPYVKSGAASIRVNSPELARRLFEAGGQHSWAKRLAPDVLRWSPENQKALLDAYFNGDGCYRGQRVEAGTASQTLAQQLRLLAIRAGYCMTPPIEQHSPSAREAGKRPKHVMQTTLVAPSKGAVTQAHLTDAGLWRRVERIAIHEYTGDVYNFDVEGDDSYVAADVAVHNCDVEKSICSICKNAASTPEDYCNHIRMKGAYFDFIDPHTKQKTSKKAYENCYGIGFFEISGVFDPADNTALSRDVVSKTQEETITQDPKERGLKDLADDENIEWLNESGEKRRKKAEFESELPHMTDPQSTEHHLLPSGRLDCPNCGGQTTDEAGNPCPMCGGQGFFDTDHAGTDGGYDIRQVPSDEYTHYPINDPQRTRYGPIRQGSVHTAENPLPQADMPHAPENIDTLRPERVCPVCGSSMDEETCDLCGYTEEPEGFDNPDLTKAQDSNLRDEPDLPDTAEPGVDAGGQQQIHDQLQDVNTPSNPTSLAHVNHDMGWETERTSARINKTEQPIVATNKPATDEPKEKILSDQSKPVTSHVRTASDFIAAAGTTRRNIQMNHTADAAAEAPAAATPDVHTEVEGVGGVDQASNEAASKANAQIDVTGIGGTGVESVGAEKEGVNVEQGTEHSKNIEAIHTDTWHGQGDSLGQHDPVTSETPQWVQDSRWSHWQVEGHDDAPFPNDEIEGGNAVRGVKPHSETFGERVNVLEHSTSPANNSGPTTQWTGTDGNGVLRQQDPVTNESIALAESGLEGKPNWTSSVHVFAAFKLADLEVELGLLPADKKYERAAELERETPQVVEASLKYAQRVKRAAVRKTAGVQRLPVMGQPSKDEPTPKEASVTEESREEASFMFGGV